MFCFLSINLKKGYIKTLYICPDNFCLTVPDKEKDNTEYFADTYIWGDYKFYR